MQNTEATEINWLIKLLDDPDTEVYEHVHHKLLQLGNLAVEHLEMAWSEAFNPVLQERIANLVHEIQFKNLKQEMRLWVDSGAFDLLRGVLLVNRYQYPDLDEQKIINQIEAIKRDIWLQMIYDASPVEQVKLINHVLYNLHGFSGNTTNHQDPQNSYLNQVLESKKGNQISLAIIYSVIAQKLDIPIYGVNLPQHFILAYIDAKPTADEQSNVLFYINSFNKGLTFGKRDVDLFLQQLKLKAEDHYYLPCTNMDIVKRVLRNLISAYDKLGSTQQVTELTQLLHILYNNKA